jgi:hypothetical protein
MGLYDSRVLHSAAGDEAHEVAVYPDESEIVDSVEARGSPDGPFGSLGRRGEAGPTPVPVELDRSAERTRDDPGRLLRLDAAELQPGREDEDIRREAVPSLVRRDPQRPLGHGRREGREHRAPTESTARIANAVTAYEHERILDEVAGTPELDRRERRDRGELEPPHLRPALVGMDDEGDDPGARATRPADEEEP